MSINALKKIEETKWFGFGLKHKSKTEIYYLLELKTPYMGGTLYTLPCPMYDIKLDLTKEEYEDTKKFDENTEFIVDLRLKEKHGKEKYE
ncbi:MAG: hypothetical protein QMC80_02105 [Thermoplasmatales archaeon]|nr:hypothetical protein [Thermoplasmatales archaeon]